MDDKGLIERPKLSFGNRIRKRMLLLFMSVERYKNADEIIKKDPDVIDALFKKFPEQVNNIHIMPTALRDEAILRNQRLLNSLPEYQRENFMVDHFDELTDSVNRLRQAERRLQIRILRKRPDLITKLMQQFSYLGECRECIKYLPEDEQFRVISEVIPYDGGSSRPNSYALKDFSEEVIKKFVIQEVLKEQKRNKIERRYVPSGMIDIYSCDFSFLPQETQLELALADNQLLDKMSPEVVERFVNGNPVIVSEILSEKAMSTFVKRNPQYAKQPSKHDDQRTEELFDKLWHINDTGWQKYTLEEVKKWFLTSNFAQHTHACGTLSRKLNVPDIYEFGKICPDIYTLSENNDSNLRKRTNSFRTFISKTSSPKIQAALTRRLNRYDLSIVEKDIECQWISKIMTNTDILERGNEDSIADYIDDPNMSKLKEIICQVYGEDNRAIFDNRPQLEIGMIRNLYIFDSKIKDVFGIDFVNDMLTYDCGAPFMLAELAMHPEKMEGFKKLDRIIGNDLFKDDTNGLCKKLQAYFRYESLITQLDESTITDEEIQNLREILCDRYYDEYHSKVTDFIPVETREDLGLYPKRKSDMFDEAISKCSSIEDMKKLVFLKLFGMNYKWDNTYDSEKLTIRQLIHMYQTESFIKDERTHSSGLFTQDELDAIELVSIINKIDDPNVLRQLYVELQKSGSKVLNAIDFKKIREKIPTQYAKEFIDSLMTLEKAQEMVKNGEPGISIETTEDGVPIVKLQGAKFNMLMHTTGLNNSGLSLPRGMGTSELWKTFEDGVSTISCCPIQSDMLKSCDGAGGMNIGFYSPDPSQIIGMGHCDIHVTHMPRTMNPTSNFGAVQFNYPDELFRKTAAQVNGTAGENKDPSHDYGEVTGKRQDQSVERGSHTYRDRRIMPDCIVVYGEGKGKYYVGSAKEFARDGKPIPIFEIDTRVYGDRSYNRAHQKEDHAIDKEDSELIKRAKEIAESHEPEKE